MMVIIVVEMADVLDQDMFVMEAYIALIIQMKQIVLVYIYM